MTSWSSFHSQLLSGALLLVAMTSRTAHALTPTQVFEQVNDSVVVIKVYGSKRKMVAQGSGVVLPSGKVATNCHVLQHGTHYEVGRDKTYEPAKWTAGDTNKDLCLLGVTNLTSKPARTGKTSQLKVGDPVYAVGSPRGLELSFTDGIVSQLRGGTPPIIQTTAAISPGSSGGGLFNDKGELIGITTFYLAEGQSLNFALPVEWLDTLSTDNHTTTKTKQVLEWIARAAALEQKKDWSGLCDLARRWISAEPNNAVAWFSLGNGYFNLKTKNYTDAVSAYHEALRIEPNYASAWYNLGRTYIEMKQYTNAVKAYREALRLRTDDAATWNSLGIVYNEMENHQGAIEAYHEALRLKPNHAVAWYNLGRTYVMVERYEPAVEAHKKAFHLDARNSKFREALINSYELLAFSHNLSGNHKMALETVKILRQYDAIRADELLDTITSK